MGENFADRLVERESLETALQQANARAAALEKKLKTSDAHLQKAVEAKSIAELEVQNSKAELAHIQSAAKLLEDNLATREALVATDFCSPQ